MPDRLEHYLTLAGEQIRWKRARPRLLSELGTHLLDQRDDCLSQGMTEEEAQTEALRQMGDPVLVGQSLDQVHRPKPQWGLLLWALLLAAAGAVLRIWLTTGWASGEHQPAWTIAALCLGCGALVGAYFLDYSWLGRHGKGIFGAFLALGLVLCVLQRTNYDLASAGLGCLTSAAPLVLALWAFLWRGQGWKGVALTLVGLAALSLVCVEGNKLGAALVLWLTALLLLWVLAGQDWFTLGKKTTRGVAGGLLAVLAAGGIWALNHHYVAWRLSLVLHPAQDPAGAGYTGFVLRQALDGAKWTGEGSWNLPVAYDQALVQGADSYFLTTILHKLGWLPLAAVVAALAGLLVWLLVKGLGQKTLLGKAVALSVTVSLLLRLALGLVSALGLPLWYGGVPLFFTSGGAAVDLALLGFVLSVFRQEALPLASPRPAKQPATQ